MRSFCDSANQRSFQLLRCSPRWKSGIVRARGHEDEVQRSLAGIFVVANRICHRYLGKLANLVKLLCPSWLRRCCRCRRFPVLGVGCQCTCGPHGGSAQIRPQCLVPHTPDVLQQSLDEKSTSRTPSHFSDACFNTDLAQLVVGVGSPYTKTC